MNPESVPHVAIDELPAELPEGATLLDVREDDEWAAGHAPIALHIPMSQVPDRLDELRAGDDVYVVCRSGGRSARVTAYLNGSGWDAVNVVGGMQDWQASGRSLTGDLHGAEPTVI